MALVEFQNNQPPYLNAENLNNNFNELNSEFIELNNKTNLALSLKEYIANNTNMNNFITTGIYSTGNNTLTNMPSNINYSWGFIIIITQTNVVHQIFIKPVSGLLYMREYSGSPAQWSSWKQISVV